MNASTFMQTVTPLDPGARLARTQGAFAGLPPEAMRLLNGSEAGERRLLPGGDLFRLGEPCSMVFSLMEGWVFRYHLLPDGRRQILDFALPGALLGFSTSIDGTMGHGAQALANAVVHAIPRKALMSACRRHPEIGLRLASTMAREQDLAFAHITGLGRQTARERVSQLLLELFVRHRMRWPGHRIEEMHLPLTQEHIGDATGLSGVHVSRVLGDMKKNGILRFSYRRLSILDPDRLLDASGIEPEQLQPWLAFPDEQEDACDVFYKRSA